MAILTLHVGASTTTSLLMGKSCGNCGYPNTSIKKLQLVAYVQSRIQGISIVGPNVCLDNLEFAVIMKLWVLASAAGVVPSRF